ncbi:HSP20 family molecular chaperone IbpA [Bacillus ectoiniformans]|uniref:hypothetical protein n=1 Tax=Bacillus ectoiniformans TaxID=1494429 RepID=UPI00195D738F|nr:hypothetical protein [Bacillus ectoiniformans]MBM7647740.1 HSP20 family molecular chaperone IbpA [Bacillus ectoiniformans]
MFPWNLFSSSFPSFDFQKPIKPEDIEQYIKKVMAHSAKNETPFEANHPKMEPANHQPVQIIETFHYVYIRLSISPADLKELKVRHTSHKIVLEMSNHENGRQEFLLPVAVKRKGVQTIYRNHLLEIALPVADDLEETEISWEDQS